MNKINSPMMWQKISVLSIPLVIMAFAHCFARQIDPITFPLQRKMRDGKRDTLPELGANINENLALACCDETEPEIDKAKWLHFIAQNLSAVIDSAKTLTIPAGCYTVKITFIVDKDGTVQEVKALNNPGYGLAESLVKVVKQSPRWIPATACGRIVRRYKTQPITLQFTDDETCDSLLGKADNF